MPHQCTSCGYCVPNGSESLFEGCSDCGNDTFQYISADVLEQETPDASSTGERSDARTPAPESSEQPTTEQQPPSTAPADSDIVDADERQAEAQEPFTEDPSQHSARTDIINRDELDQLLSTPDRGTTDDGEDRGVQMPVRDAPSVDLSKLQQELSRQFDGISVVKPGEYEINLTRLFEGDEHVITLKEDGRYTVNPPEAE